MDIEPIVSTNVETAIGSAPLPSEPEVLALRAIVKVFVIESSEGGWIDCGTGDFYLQNAQLEDGTFSLRIRVEDKPDPAETREQIDPVREKKLRGPTGDPKLLVDVPIQDAMEFMRCQSSFVADLVTIVTWEQKNIKESIALSFLYAWECKEFWKYICQLRGMVFEDDLPDLTAANLPLINRKLDEEPEMKAVYSTEFLRSVDRVLIKQNSLDPITKVYFDAVQAGDEKTLCLLGEMIERLIMSLQVDLIYRFITEAWEEVAGSLEYTPTNNDGRGGRIPYIHYLGTQCKQLTFCENLPQEVAESICIRHRAVFLFEFAMLSFFNDENNSKFLQNVGFVLLSS